MSKFSKLVRNPRLYLRDSEAFGLVAKNSLGLVRRSPRLSGFVSSFVDVKAASLSLARAEMRRIGAKYDLSDKAERKRSTIELEELFFEILSDFDPELFIEAGAKDAGTSRRVRTILEDASIVAFEANPYTFQRFDKKHNNDAVDVEYRNMALSESEGHATFKVCKRNGQPSADGQSSLLGRTDPDAEHIEVTVPATTLNAVVEEFEANTCVLWVDVEGANEIVLKGASLALSRASAVFIEVEDKEFWESQWLSEKVESFLYDAGLHPVARDYQSTHQHNVLFIREDLLNSEAYGAALGRYQAKTAVH